MKNIKDNYIRRISITNSISEDEATVKANQWLFNSLLLAVASIVLLIISSVKVYKEYAAIN